MTHAASAASRDRRALAPPVVRREAHADDVSVDVDHVVQRVEELFWAALPAQHGPAGAHLVGHDALDAWEGRREARR